MPEANAEQSSIFVSIADSKFKYVNSVGTIEILTSETEVVSKAMSTMRNMVRQLQDRAVYLDATGGELFDAYTDTTGRMDTVTTGTTTATFSTDKYTTTASATSYVYHAIPTDTFSTTIDSSILSVLVEDWEAGASISYKFTNTGAEDSGWLDADEVATFTAFTAEPDVLIIRLVPKGSPTAGYPSINGYGVIEC